jgi:glycosyltransferase involved in cell wall biosynthesis
MISVVYCTREENPKHKEHLIKTSGLHKKIEVIEIINNGESLTKSYNRGLEQASNDIVVFCHDDITLETKQWGKKLLKLYSENEDYSILGVAGTKNLSSSGRWWDDKKAMYGRVKHTHEGKSWLSTYSPDQNNRIEEVVVVDGVFFSVRKSGIKKNFDESVEGFHFYDVSFCFQNRLEGVKVGVHTNIRVNHQSIGMTNEQWEKNRTTFANKYEELLPVRIDETFENRKMKILVGCINFQGLTGSEISTLELVKGLSNTNCDVSVISNNISEKFRLICKRYGINTYTIQEPPGYKLGDGKWGMNTPQGFQPSKPNTLYRLNDTTFDVVHANHTPITTQLLNLYPECKFVNIVRSEVINLEDPVIHKNIKEYIAIRPSIKEYMVNSFDIPENKIRVIYNLFDKTRFNPNTSLPSGTNKKVTLFVGTMDYLREKPINELVGKCGEDNKELWLVGKDTKGYASTLSEEHEHVNYFPPTENIEEFYYKCDETAGIFLGRTTIEGFLCGKPAIIYTVNDGGEIINSEYQEVPDDLSIFDNDTIIKNIKQTYIDAFNSN